MEIENLIQYNEIEKVKELLYKGWSPDEYLEKGKTALILAIIDDNIDMVKILIDNGADVNMSEQGLLGRTPLIHAVIKSKGKNLDMIKLLLGKGANLEKGDSGNRTPLVHACIEGFPEILLYFINMKADVNTRDRYGRTPLHYICCFATEWGEGTITEVSLLMFNQLLKNGADANASDNNELTLLHNAAANGANVFLKPLVEYGAEVNFINSDLYTPIHAAAISGQLACSETLIELGADINAVDIWGFTTLIYAVVSENIDLVRLFLEKGVDKHAKILPQYGSAAIFHMVSIEDTALDIAKKMNRMDIVDLLK